MLPQVEFSYNATRALGVEHKPSKANFGFISHEEPPQMLLNMLPSILVSQDAMTRLQQLHELHIPIRSVLQLHKDDIQTRTYVSIAPHFTRGDKIIAFTKNLFVPGQPNIKLRDRQLGSFIVEEHIGKYLLHIETTNDRTLTSGVLSQQSVTVLYIFTSPSCPGYKAKRRGGGVQRLSHLRCLQQAACSPTWRIFVIHDTL
jgi:hypothetical protein